MKKDLGNLSKALQKLLGLYRQLAELLRRERTAIASADLKAIQEATFEKEALIEQIRAAEGFRQAAAAGIAIALRRPAAQLTLAEIAATVQSEHPAQAKEIRSAGAALSLLIKRSGELNAENRGLVEKSLEHVDQMKSNVLGEANAGSQTYTPQGQKTQGSGAARLLSREA